MKFFSKKKSLALFVSGLLSLAFFGAGLGSLTNETALATDTYTRPEATNIEDMIDGRGDVYLPRGNAGTSDGSLDSNWNTALISTVAYDHSGAYFFDKKTSDAKNFLDQTGNIGICLENDATADRGTAAGTALNVSVAGIKIKASKQTAYGQSLGATTGNGYGLVAFRTNFVAANRLTIGVMATDNNAYGIADSKWDAQTGVSFQLNGANFAQVWKANGSTKTKVEYNYSSGATIADNTEVIVTFGAYKTSETTDAAYFSIVDAATPTTVYAEYTLDMTANGIPYPDAANASFSIFTVVKPTDGGADNQLLIAGVDEPLYQIWERPEATNLEDLIDSRSDVKLTRGNAGFVDANTDSNWNTAFINIDTTLADYSGIYFFDTKTSEEKNFLDVTGNIGLYSENDAAYDRAAGAAMNASVAGIKLNASKQTAYGQSLNTTENPEAGYGYGLVAFRTKFVAANCLTLGVLSQDHATLGIASSKWDAQTGVSFQLNDSYYNQVWKANGSTNTMTQPAYSSGTTIADNTEVIITFGAYKTSATTNVAYFSIVDAANSTVYAEQVFDMTANGVKYPDAAATNATFSIFTVVKPTDGGADNKLLIAGVEEPLMMDSYKADCALEGLTGAEDATLSTVDLPAGYTWKNDQTVMYTTTTKYPASYTANYYGNELSFDLDLDVNVEVLGTMIQLMDGTTVLASKNVKTGTTLNLSTVELTGVDTVIGWTKGTATELYRPDYVFEATAATEGTTLTFNVVDMDMKLYDGASVRTTKDANGTGGIRFLAMFDSADWTANAAYIQNAYGVIVPTDDKTYFNDAFTAAARSKYAVAANNFKGQTAQSYADVNLTEAQAGGYALYTFTLADILYQNYNRTFAAMAYITVSYAEGDALVFETAYNAQNNSRSIYDVAIAAYTAHVNSGNSLYSNAQLEVIKGYISNVVDVTLDGTTLTLADREGHGIARAYTFVSGSVSENTVTIVLTVAADSLLATNASAPVWMSEVGANGVVTRYKANVAYADGTATLTFTK